MQFKASHIAPLVAIGAAAVAIAAAPLASATTSVNGTTNGANTGNAQISVSPGAAAQEAAQLQQPFGGDSGALIFHRR